MDEWGLRVQQTPPPGLKPGSGGVPGLCSRPRWDALGALPSNTLSAFLCIYTSPPLLGWGGLRFQLLHNGGDEE